MDKSEKEPMRNEEVEVDEEPEINYRGLKVIPLILGNETFEKLGALGTLSNLLVYLTTVFNLKSITATTLLNVFSGTTNSATLIGAFLSDTYFGRYNTIAFCSVTTFLGLIVVALTAVFKGLHPPQCQAKEQSPCIPPSNGQMAFLLSGFALMVIGAAGIRPCSLAFGADQFNPKIESGKKGINSFFNWYYFTLTFAQMISVTVVVYVQSKIWSVGLMIPAICMLVACFLFFVGTNMYVKVKPEGNPFATPLQVTVAAIKKRNLKLPEQPYRSLFRHAPSKSINLNLPCTDQFRFLNKAAIVTNEDRVNSDGSPVNPWRLCSIQQVEELKCILRVIPIWASAVIYHIAIIQQQQYVVLQALQSDRHLGKFVIPAATYTIFSMMSLTIFVPIYDRFLVPWLRRLTGKETGITVLQRIGVGIVLAILSSFISVFIEQKRRLTALSKPTLGYENHRGEISSMSAFWLVPQLILAGIAEAFTAIGQTEFYYKQFPENMRSVAGSLIFCGFSASSYLNSFLVSIIHRFTKGAASGNWLPEDLNKGTLDYFYYLITALGVMNLVYFLLCSKWYKYKDTGGSIMGVEMETKEELDNRLV